MPLNLTESGFELITTIRQKKTNKRNTKTKSGLFKLPRDIGSVRMVKTQVYSKGKKPDITIIQQKNCKKFLRFQNGIRFCFDLG